MNFRLADPMIDDKQLERIREVLMSKQLVHGAACISFENELAEYLRMDKESVAVTSSCTASLHLALMALEIGRGDSVLVPNFTFPATVNAVEILGANPIFVDVDPHNYCMSALELEKTVIEWNGRVNLKAVIVVHEFGAWADMNSIREICNRYDLILIEDAACAFGTEIAGVKVGTESDVGCFSFHPRKAITTGEGGAIVSRNKALIDRVKVLRNHGMCNIDGKIDFIMPGLNYRMTNFQAVMGSEQLKYFDEWIEIRRSLQKRYREKLSHKWVSHPDEQAGHTWQSYMIVLDEKVDRTRLIHRLREMGVESNYGAYAVSETDYYKKKYGALYLGKLGVSKFLYDKGLCLPLHQGLIETDIDYICESVINALMRAENE